MKRTAAIIKENRLRSGFTQEDLAKKLDITTSYLSLIENAKRDPSLKLRKRIAKCLNIPLSLLVLADMQSAANSKAEKSVSRIIQQLYEQIEKQA